PLSSSWQARRADCLTEKAELCATEQWARGQARKREARPSPEPLLPAEGRGGTAAMGKSNGQGGGAARSAQREATALQDVQ
ncbi:hypothetical protein DKX15_20760, partial [Enterococcus faecium]